MPATGEDWKPTHNTILLGIPFSGRTNDETLDLFDEMISLRTRNIIVTANLDSIVRTLKDPILKRIMYSAPLVTPDGMPLVWAGKTMKPALTERVAGSDFIPMLLERAAQKGHSVFFLGGREEVALRAAEQCAAKYRGLKIAGVFSPPFGTVWEMNNADIIARINDASPDILIIAFGAPKQEYWMAMNYLKLDVPVSIGVGATIDFLSGMVPRAPKWMKTLSAEWLFRLLLEPRRLAKRYALDVRDGLIPLVLQTLTDAVIRSVQSFSRTGVHDTLDVSKFSVLSEKAEVRVAMLEECTKQSITRLASNLDHHIGSETDAVILDLRSCSFLDSELLSDIVLIDQALRKRAKQCLLITGAAANAILRIAKLYDLLTIVNGRETAIEQLRRMGRHTLAVVEHQGNHHTRILTLHGELTNDSAFLLDEVRPVLLEGAPVIFDFGGIRFFDTGGIQYLLDLWKETRGTGESMHCVTSDKFYTSMFRAPGLQPHVVVHATNEEATASLNGAGSRQRLGFPRAVEAEKP